MDRYFGNIKQNPVFELERYIKLYDDGDFGFRGWSYDELQDFVINAKEFILMDFENPFSKKQIKTLLSMFGFACYCQAKVSYME